MIEAMHRRLSAAHEAFGRLWDWMVHGHFWATWALLTFVLAALAVLD